MEIVDPKSRELRFKLRPKGGDGEITIEMTEFNGRLKEGGLFLVQNQWAFYVLWLSKKKAK